MSLIMRPYQQDAIDNVYAEWARGKRFVVLVMPTGSGKAACLCEVARIEAERGQRVLITAHRQELITQLSTTLARNGLRHQVIAAATTVKYAVRLHMETVGKCFVDPNARVFVASVQSMKAENVAPHAGAWIETWPVTCSTRDSRVAPHAGAWIETCSNASILISP